MNEKLLRVGEAGDLMGVKGASIRQLEKKGKLRAVRDWNGHRRFKKSEILRFRDALLKQ